MSRISLVLLVASLAGCVPRALIEDAKDRDDDGFQAAELGGPDCDDSAPAVNPDAPEICGDGVDNDCDGATDNDGIGSLVFYGDADGDAYGDLAVPITACTLPLGYATNGDDCDDAAATVHPGADETCNGSDDDCDETKDEQAIDQPTWYLDRDADGFGEASATLVQCGQPAGYAATGDDCNDDALNVHPGADEVCNGWDDDCNNLVDYDDPGMSGLQTWYRDMDGDNWGRDDDTQSSCTQPSGYVPLGGDCDDDASPTIHPGAPEVCNSGVDDDCDTTADDGDSSLDLGNATTWYFDADADGYGLTSSAIKHCASPGPTYVLTGGDCDDSGTWAAQVHPAAGEVCDGIKNDCDALEVPPSEVDNDGDGFVECDLAAGPGWRGGGAAPGGLDCDDTNTWAHDVHPGANELCDGVRDDCTLAALPVNEVDNDGDGFVECTILAVSNWHGAAITNGGDCDDTSTWSATNYPGAPEVCDGGVNACGGTMLSAETDPDGDHWITCTLVGTPGRNGTLGGGDCNNGAGGTQINPGVSEVCADGIDNNCDAGQAECRFEGTISTSSATHTFTGDGSDVKDLGKQVVVGDHDGTGNLEIFALSGSATYSGENAAVVRSGGAMIIDSGASTTTVTVPRPARDVLIVDGLADRAEGILPCVLDGDGLDDLVFARDRWANPPTGPWHRTGDEPSAYLSPLAAGQYAIASAPVNFTHGSGGSVASGGLRLAACGALRDNAFRNDLLIDNRELFYGPSTTAGQTNLDAPDATFSAGSAYAMTSLDGDTLDELLIGAPANQAGKGEVYVLDNPGTGSLSLLTPYAVGSTAATALGSSVGAADVDGNGTPDLIAGSADGIYVWLQPAGALGTDDADHLIGGASLVLVTADDMDGDGRADLLIRDNSVNPNVYVLVYSDPDWGSTVTLSGYPHFAPAAGQGALASAAIGDVTGDGFPEIILGAPSANTNGSVFLFEGNGR